MKPYLETLKSVNETGKLYGDRTGTGRYRQFGAFETYDLSEGVPLVTTRQIFTKNMCKELIGFIRGSTNVEGLTEAFWSKWAVKEENINEVIQDELAFIKNHFAGQPNPPTDEDLKGHRDHLEKTLRSLVGSVGPIYGALWRNFPRVGNQPQHWVKSIEDIPSDVIAKLKDAFMTQVALSSGELKNTKEDWERFALGHYLGQGIDQLAMVMKQIKEQPYSSRHRITAHHPGLIGPESLSPELSVINGYAALAPCHTFFQFMVTDNDEGNKELNCMLYMSSSDVPVGRPYNIAQYSILTMMMAHCLDMAPGKFSIVSCDTHIYANQKEKVSIQLERTPLQRATVLFPKDKKDLFAFEPEDITIVNYIHHERIDYPVAK